MDNGISTRQAFVPYLLLALVIAHGVTSGIAISNKLL